MAKKKTNKVIKSSKKPVPKVSKGTSKTKKKNITAKDINVVVPVPVPIPVNIPVTIPTDLKLLDRLKSIKDKVFSTFGLKPND